MYVSPREDKAKLNARRIQAEIMRVLRENAQGLHFNEIFRQLKSGSFLKNYNILSANLKDLMLKGLIKKTELPGRGFGKSIYQLTGELEDKLEGRQIPSVTFDMYNSLPFALTATVDVRSGELKRVHVEKGKKDDFCKAIIMLNSVSEHFRPVNQRMHPEEKRYFKGLLENMLKLLRIQSSILRDKDPTEEDATWPVYLSVIISNLEALFKSYASYASQQPREEMLENSRALRQSFSEICVGMLMEKSIYLNRVQIYEKTSTNVGLEGAIGNGEQ
jgi:DNA-binding HxlR family transcriptional regulator